MPIAVALGSAAFIMILADPSMMIRIVSGSIYNGIAKYLMLAIPYFVLAGIIMEYSGISKRLVVCARAFVGHYHGGLIIVVAAVSCFFGAISGSGTACIAAIGSIIIPAMVHDGYDRGLSTALLSISAGIGIVIPPSIVFVIYAMVANISIVELFTAGIFPGILLGIGFSLTGLWLVRKDKNILVRQRATWREKISVLKDAFWGLLSPLIILGGIYSGVFTPTEAAGISVVYTLFVGLFIYKELKLRDLWRVAVDSAKATAMIMFIIAFANVFAWYLSASHLAGDIASSLISFSSNKYILLFCMNIVYLIAGCFIDPTSICFIILPIFLPICRSVGIDIVHFGVITTVACMLGLVTPPVGTNLYVGAKICGVTPTENARKLVPFIAIGCVLLLLISFLPDISLFLPKLLKS